MRYSRFAATVLVIGLLQLVVTPSGIADVAITGCGEFVPEKEVGVLQNDLVGCSALLPAVYLADGAILDLNGHSIASGKTGVFCLERKCTIHGPGEITGTLNAAIATTAGEKARMAVSDVDVHDNATDGIAFGGARSKLALDNVMVSNNGRNGISLDVGKVKGTDVVINDNGGNGLANVKGFKFTRLTMQNSGALGIVSSFGKGKLIDSVLSGNNANDPNGTMDIATIKIPKLVRTTCDRSGIIPESQIIPGALEPGWGVCTGD